MQCVKCGQEIMGGAAFCPFCGEKVAAGKTGDDKPIYQADVKGMFKSGKLTVYGDRVEFCTSSVQKTIFNYNALVSVKKRLVPTPAVLFITEDGRTESCAVTMKNIHEAFLYIEQASRPYIEERKRRLLSQGIRYSFVSSMGLTNSGILNISDDKAELKTKSGQSKIVSFEDVKSVGMAAGSLEFLLYDGTARSFALDRETQDEVFSFVKEAVEPYIAKRKKALLEQGIYYSFLNGQGSESVTVDILEDRVECKTGSGQSSIVFFRDVREIFPRVGTLELGLTNGTTRAFAIDVDLTDEVLAFVENAIHPYVMQRTVGFDAAFGIDEKIEVNEERGVFHILRQDGNVITEEYPLTAIAKCEQTECSAPKSALGLLAGAAKAVGVQGTLGAPDADDVISYAGVVLTIHTDQDVQSETVRFGDFSLGMSRGNKKYDPYLLEISKFMEYLGSLCPECELILAVLPKPEDEPARIEGGSLEIAAGSAEVRTPPAVDTAAAKDEFGLIKYIEGVTRFIDGCAGPMAIAIQGSRGSGRNSIMKMLSDSLKGSYPDSRMWFSTRQMFQSGSDDSLSMLVGRELIRQLRGTESGGSKDSAVKIAKGAIELVAGVIAPDSSAGTHLVEGLFRDGSGASFDKLIEVFSEMIKKRANNENGKFIIFIDDLNRLSPVKAVEFLEALRDFSECDGCIFVIAVDYDFFQRGVRGNAGMDESREKVLFDEIFQISFRVPASSYQTENYIRDRLERMGIGAADEEELGFYDRLIQSSVGSDPKTMDRLFNSFLLLQNMDDRELYENRTERLILFALLCMQTRFRAVYNELRRIKDEVTPELISGLRDEDSEVAADLGLAGEEKAEFHTFAGVLFHIIDTNDADSISQSECSMFAQVLEFSGITSK